MKHISVLVPEGGSLASIECPRFVFAEVNKFLERQGKPAMFHIELLGLGDTVVLNGGMYTVQTKPLADVGKTDLVVVPALNEDMEKNLEANQGFQEWIIRQYQAGAEVASLCVGAFLLASTGLLIGRKCATHWMGANNFRRMFPDVNLVEDKIITDESGIYSSGGGLSFMNLIIYIVEKYAGREAAVFCAKFFQIDFDRASQSPFIIFQGQKGHEDEGIKRAQEFIELNFKDKISVERLSDLLALSRRSLERRFKKATSNTVSEYIQRVKIEAAKKQLEISAKNISEVMYEVGYTDQKAFRASFKTITGLSPIEYRNKYNKNAAVEA
ncbi:helix-turn-helix domain-containing protein [Chitinophaga lutea]|uniref:Helix-turn-helix domain-containing protein n=1 Tax=Chitinophaga lutea TaxID=2488634 RepID=A0A3N4PX54_9BACT|nr:helix-turn-helix domain-containing protein [Chitinophaga lutea]RPE12486.1 helix-turn-helix domain-containing protein [Chitinophaga lutea]